MSSSAPTLRYVGDRTAPFTGTTLDDAGAVVDITGATVVFKMRAVGSSTLKVAAGAATIVTAAAGTVKYDPAAIDVDTEGLYLAWFEVTIAAKTRTIVEDLVEIRAHAPITGNLVELEEVRLAMELPPEDRTLDARIRECIRAATDAIEDEIKRELVPTTGATRKRATLGDRILSLSPWDLRTATTVTLDPDGTPKILTANVDYLLLPVGGSDALGTFTELELSSQLSLTSLGFQFDHTVVQILGDWGPLTVPKEAKEACIVTVRSWLRRDVATFAGFADDSGGRILAPPGAYGIPAAARNLLGRLYRFPGGGGVA